MAPNEVYGVLRGIAIAAATTTNATAKQGIDSISVCRRWWNEMGDGLVLVQGRNDFRRSFIQPISFCRRKSAVITR